MTPRGFSLACAAALLLSAAADPAAPREGSAERKAVERGLDYLLKAQNADGSWGGLEPRVVGDEFWWVPETHRAWRVATTGLAMEALLAHGPREKDREALRMALDYLVGNAAGIQRPSDWDTDHLWGWIYALDALAAAELHPALDAERARIRPVVGELIRHLARNQTPAGGWGYYDFPKASRQPAWTTSFTTANGILALRKAREAGHALPPRIIPDALAALRRARLPSGAYEYDVRAVPRYPRIDHINDVKGSLGRIQVCSLARFLEKDGVSEADLETGLGLLFRHHRFLDAACYRPIPHEAYYRNSGYFYLYGHAYAAEAIRRLPPARQREYRPLLVREILKLQGEDGAWWDYPMMGYARPYGTAFALLALAK